MLVKFDTEDWNNLAECCSKESTAMAPSGTQMSQQRCGQLRATEIEKRCLVDDNLVKSWARYTNTDLDILTRTMMELWWPNG